MLIFILVLLISIFVAKSRGVSLSIRLDVDEIVLNKKGIKTKRRGHAAFPPQRVLDGDLCRDRLGLGNLHPGHTLQQRIGDVDLVRALATAEERHFEERRILVEGRGHLPWQEDLGVSFARETRG